MRDRTWLVLLTLSAACGPSYGGQGAKTPEEIVAEQERIAVEEEKQNKGSPSGFTPTETDEEKLKKFDKRQAKLELQRATRSAESCVGVVDEKNAPRGETKVTVTFSEDGHVKNATIPSPFDGTRLGDCVLRAYKGVIVPPFIGGDQITDWPVSLLDQPKEKAKDDKKGAGETTDDE